jgi:hypothetical protein
MAAEMQRMRHQVELLQAELLCVREGSLFEEMQVSVMFLMGRSEGKHSDFIYLIIGI